MAQIIENKPIVKGLKRNMYKWHRVLGILTVIPVIFWACSGLGHPIIAHWFKAPVAHEFMKPEPIEHEQLKLSVREVLSRNGIDVFSTARLVRYQGQTYYQVKDRKNELLYFSAADGTLLQNGEQLYAEYLGRYFLGDSTSKIKSIEKITSFDGEYQYVNRLLPVWKLSFDRADKMDVYVETLQSRLANYNDTNRKVFIWIFSNFHSYSFVEKITNNTIRYILILVFSGIVICSTLSGLLIYGFLWKKFKKPKDGQKLGFLRRNHRSIGIAVSIVTLSFVGSGAYHASRKFTPDDRIKAIYEPELTVSGMSFSSNDLPLNWNRVSDISVVGFNNRIWYLVRSMKAEDDSWEKQQVNNAESMHKHHHQMNKPNLHYYSAADGQLLEDGVIKHSISLAQHFELEGATKTGVEASKVSSSAFLTTFDHNYGFVNKRLPVVKLDLSTPSHLTYYIEPLTSRLAAKVQDADRREGLSFAIFHKYLLVDFAGKNFRDFLAAFAAIGVLVVSVTGLILFVKAK